MRRLSIRCLFTVLAVGVLASPVAAQPVTVLFGRVLDETGIGLPGVNVHLHHAQGEMPTGPAAFCPNACKRAGWSLPSD